jgi:hypothetical protein
VVALVAIRVKRSDLAGAQETLAGSIEPTAEPAEAR